MTAPAPCPGFKGYADAAGGELLRCGLGAGHEGPCGAWRDPKKLSGTRLTVGEVLEALRKAQEPRP